MSVRNTKTKSMILESLKKSKQAVSHETLQNELQGHVDRATIYRVLNRFCEEGLVHRVVGDDGKQYFAICINCAEHQHHHDHFHFRCIRCGKVECLQQEIALSLPKGYRAVHFNGVVSGYCDQCGDPES